METPIGPPEDAIQAVTIKQEKVGEELDNQDQLQPEPQQGTEEAVRRRRPEPRGDAAGGAEPEDARPGDQGPG